MTHSRTGSYARSIRPIRDASRIRLSILARGPWEAPWVALPGTDGGRLRVSRSRVASTSNLWLSPPSEQTGPLLLVGRRAATCETTGRFLREAATPFSHHGALAVRMVPGKLEQRVELAVGPRRSSRLFRIPYLCTKSPRKEVNKKVGKVTLKESSTL